MIIDYLIESLLYEGRFELIQPQNYKFYGIEGLDVDVTEDDQLLIQCVGPYIFAFDENLFDMGIKTTMIYPVVKNEYGSIQYDTYGTKVKPVYIDNDSNSYDLTDNIIKTNKNIQTFLSSPLIVDVDLDFSFDLSEHDPSYSDDKSFQTLDSGTPSDVFRKLNNVAYILKDYMVNFEKFVKNKIQSKVFGSKYSILLAKLKYNLNIISFSGKQDHNDDMRRANLYKKWFGSIAGEYGTLSQTNIDGIDFQYKYTNSQLS